MSATATTEKKYLKWYQKLAYGSGDLASNCSYGLVSSFVLLYLTGTLGLDSAIIGSLMLASKVLDGISDVIFGTLIDRTHSKLGKARPWMLFGQVGVSLCLFLLFAIPAGSTTMQYIYFFIVYTALNAVFYTANGIAYSSLVALITKNNNERVQLGSFRFMFAVVTNIFMGFAVTGMVEKFGSGAAGWRTTALIFAIVGLVVNTISSVLGIPMIYFAMQKNLSMFLLFMFIKGIFAGTLSGSLNALIAEASGYTTRTTGVHMDGMMYSCSSLGVKVGGGIGTAAVGWLLKLGGFVGTATVQSESAIRMIFNLYITFPFVIGIIITVLLAFLDVEKANKKWDAEHQKEAQA